jgi:23S rRNA (uracil1939-C5)-methyltransferase
MVRKGDLVEVEIKKLALGGKGFAKVDGLPVFIDRGIPGQKVNARIKNYKRKYAEGVIDEVLKKSTLEQQARCPYFASSERINDMAKNCGGCSWQNLSYAKQLEIKQGLVKETLEHVGKFKGIEVDEIIGSPSEWYYRNKIELSFGHNELGHTDFGFRQKGKFREIVPIEECVIFDAMLPAVLDVIRRYVQMQDWEVFDFKDKPDGFWQFLIIRRGVNTGEWMINFVTRPGQEIHKYLVSDLEEVLGDKLQSVIHTVNFGKAISYAGHDNKKVNVLFGRDYILEKMVVEDSRFGNRDLQFKISPFSFFQTNTGAAEKLYALVAECAGLTGNERVFDLYCGTGTIGQFMAKDAREVIGVEILKEAIADANENARMNHLANCKYEATDVNKYLMMQKNRLSNVDLVILDPPRAGIAKKALMKILELRANKIVYVSCNPATLARDLVDIVKKRYDIKRVQPVDLFPHTAHVETVVELVRKR